MAAGFRVSLVIPAWNEQDTIRQAVQEAAAALSRVASDYEIIVVDDGSTDRTPDLVRAEATANSKVRLLQHPTNFGYGAALRTGFQEATLDLVAFTDADCQFHLNELEYMLPLTRRYDITCGYRIDRQDPARRRFFSWGYNTLVTMLMGSPVHDIDCALKIFRRDALQSILPECNNFFVNTEMLTKARLQGLSVVEVGVHHRPRAAGESKVSLWDIPKTLSALLPFWWSRVLFPAKAEPSLNGGASLWSGLMLLALIAGAILFPNLSYPLLEPDEGRYAEIGREMLIGGDWIVPTLNQRPYYDKPPLYYWLTASSFQLFGMSEWAARIVPACAAFLTVLMTVVIGRRMVGPRAAFLGALVLCLTSGFVQCGRLIILDSVFSLFITGSLLAACVAMQREKIHWPWWIASAICCGLGVLTKGPVAFVLIIPPIVAYAWLNRTIARPSIVHWGLYAGLALSVAAPWYVAIILRDPNFAHYFFVDQNLQRFMGKYHDKPIWYYIPILLISGLPWSLLLVPFIRFLCSRSPKVGLLRLQTLGFCLLWAIWCVVFFSLSRGKLPPYILPAAPAVALLLGGYLERVLFDTSMAAFFHKVRHAMPLRATAILAMGWLIIATFGWLKELIGPIEYAIQMSLCCGCIIGIAMWGRRVPVKLAWGLSFVVVLALVHQSAHELVPAWSNHCSPLGKSGEISMLLRDDKTPVACYGREWGSLTFYLCRDNVRNFDKRSPDDLRRFLAKHHRSLLIVKADEEPGKLQWAMPSGKKISRVFDAGAARIMLVEAASSSRRLELARY